MSDESKLDPGSGQTECSVLADQAWLQRLARRLIADPVLAEDACQEAWLSSRVRAVATAERRPHLFRVMRRFAWRWHRSESRRLRRETTAARIEALPSTAELLERGEQRELLWRRLKELEEPFRTTLLLRFQEHLSVREIARRGGLREDTVRWRIRRGLETLRRRYEADEASGVGFGGLASLITVASFGTPARAAAQIAGGVGLSWLPVGVVTLKKIAAAACVLLFLCLLVLMEPNALGGGAEPSRTEAGPMHRIASESVEPMTSKAEDSAARTAASEPVALPPVAGRVLGRVVEERGLGLAGVRVRLVADAGRGAAQASWTRETRTVSDGHFEVVAAAPQRFGRLRLIVDPPRQLRGVERSFGSTGDVQFGPLNGQTVDVGELRLHPGASVRGRLIGEDGVPIPGVRVGGGEFGTTSAGGEFVLEHLEPGERSIRFSASGYLVREIDIVVEPGPTKDLGDVVLAAGPRVQGIVTDVSGQPIPHATVSTRGYTRGWRFEVAADGTFDVPLPTASTAALRARASGFRSSRSVRIAAGDSGVRIELEPAPPRGLIRAVDRATGDPVTRYGVQVTREPDAELLAGYSAHDESAWMHRAGGEARVTCRVDRDQVVLTAPGYRPAVATVLPEAMSAEGQVVLLDAAPQVHGRIVGADGRPFRGQLTVRMRVGGLARTIDDESGEPVPFASSSMRREFESASQAYGGYSMNRWRASGDGVNLPAVALDELCERRLANLDDEGRFRFVSPRRGCFELAARTRDGRVLGRALVRLPETGDMDLGDLPLLAPGRVEGRIDLGDGSVADAVVRLNSRYSGRVPIGPAGQFVVANLPPGRHALFVSHPRHARALPEAFVFDVAAGQTIRWTLPLEAQATCQLEVSVRLNEEVVDRATLFVSSEDPDVASQEIELRGGRGEARLPAGVELRVDLMTEGCRVPLGLATLSPGPARQTFAVRTRSLEFELPRGFTLLDEAHYQLVPSGSGSGSGALRVDPERHFHRDANGSWLLRIAHVDDESAGFALRVRRRGYASSWEAVADGVVERFEGRSGYGRFTLR